VSQEVSWELPHVQTHPENDLEHSDWWSKLVKHNHTHPYIYIICMSYDVLQTDDADHPSGQTLILCPSFSWTNSGVTTSAAVVSLKGGALHRGVWSDLGLAAGTPGDSRRKEEDGEGYFLVGRCLFIPYLYHILCIFLGWNGMISLCMGRALNPWILTPSDPLRRATSQDVESLGVGSCWEQAEFSKHMTHMIIIIRWCLTIFNDVSFFLDFSFQWIGLSRNLEKFAENPKVFFAIGDWCREGKHFPLACIGCRTGRCMMESPHEPTITWAGFLRLWVIESMPIC
jgi:hypothetical protein